MHQKIHQGEGHLISAIYITHDGGNSWEAADVYEQKGPSPKTARVSETDMDVVPVFAAREFGVQIHTAKNTISSRYRAALSPSGIVGTANFVDNLHGWLTYSSKKCTKLLDIGSGELRCLALAETTDLLSTSDGGKTFRITSPPTPTPLASASPATSQNPGPSRDDRKF